MIKAALSTVLLLSSCQTYEKEFQACEKDLGDLVPACYKTVELLEACEIELFDCNLKKTARYPYF